jgi:carboxypeptidase family protein
MISHFAKFQSHDGHARYSLLILLLLVAISSRAQVDKATINGSVTDQSGAMISDAKITAVNSETGANFSAASNNAGIYQILALPVGHYTVHFAKPGFRALDRTGLVLETGQVAQVNVRLNMGTVSEKVEVVAGAPVLLDTETPTVGTIMQGKALEDLPLDINGGRDITMFIYSNVPTTNGGNWIGHIGGSQDKSKNVMVDGTDATSGLQGFVQDVGMEAVQEMNVQVSGISAEAASTGGGTVLLEMKSGTNKFHGSGYYYLENEALDANGWDNNFFGAQCAKGDASCRNTFRTPRDRFDDWGYSASGPIWKNHTFIFGDWEHYRNVTLSFAPNQTTVPTQAFMNGDFSALLGGPLQVTNSAGQTVTATDPCTGQPILSGQIYDPSAMFVNSSGVTCNVPFAGNIIPSNRISPVSQNIITNIYQKFYQPKGSGSILNFPTFTGNLGQTVDHIDLKLDHIINSKQRLAVSYNWWKLPYAGAGAPPNGLFSGGSTPGPFYSGLTQTQWDRSIRAQHFYTLSPTMLNSFSAVYNEHTADDSPPSPFDPAKVGIAGTNGKNFPIINFNDGTPGACGGQLNNNCGVNGFGEINIGEPFSDGYVQYNRLVSDTVSWVRGRHSFKFGGDFQARGMNSREDNGIRTYNFSNTTGGPLDPQIQNNVGFAFANFLLGDVQNASQSVGYLIHGRRKRTSLFASDDVKLTPKLTVNASLRWDFNFRFHETDGKWSNFDLNAVNPAWGGYKGAWTFANGGGSSFEKNQDYHEFGPHVGAAYQLRNNLVLRGGYGIFYSPLAFNQWNGVPFATTGGAFGFIGSNTFVNNSVDGVGFQWDAGYPGQSVFPARTSTQTFVNSGVAYTWPDALTMGRTQNWNAGAEYLISKDAVLSVNYLGNHGSDLHDGSTWPFNFPTQAAYLKLFNSGHVNDLITNPAQAAAAGVPYPYAGFSGYAYQAISPYPQVRSQFQQVQLANSDLAQSNYKALVAELRTHGGHGFTTDLSYTLSRSEGNASDSGAFVESWTTLYSQDPYNLKNLTHQVNDWNHTHEVKGYIDYDLPFGHGKKWATGWQGVDSYLLGGWTVGSEFNYHSGEPIWMIAAANQYPGWDAVFAQRTGASLHNSFRTLNLNWNPSACNCADPGSVYFNPAAYTSPAPGAFSPEKYSIQDSLRNWAYADEDISIVKRFSFGNDGRFHASLRGQFFDAFNRHRWGAPNTDINSPFFGHVTGVSGHRYGQLGARIEW